MTECDCGAPTEGEWADIHSKGCASVRALDPLEALRAITRLDGRKDLPDAQAIASAAIAMAEGK
jgi:hypothetical protein